MKWTGISSCITSPKAVARRGFSLTEVAIVIGVIGVIVGSVWVFAGQSWKNGRQEQVKDEIYATVKNVRAYYGNQNGISGAGTVLTPTLITDNVVPGDMVRRPPNAGGCTSAGSLCADHPWGSASATVAQTGSFLVCAWAPGVSTSCANGGASTPFFSIELKDVPQNACIKAVLNNSGANTPLGFYDVVINGASMLALGKGLPPVISDAKTNCNTPTSNVIDFVFRVVPPQT